MPWIGKKAWATLQLDMKREVREVVERAVTASTNAMQAELSEDFEIAERLAKAVGTLTDQVLKLSEALDQRMEGTS